MSYSLFYALIPWTQTSSAMHLLNKYLIENFSNKEKYLIFENGVNNTVNSMCSARVNQHTHTYTHGYRWQWRGQAAAKITETSFHNLLCLPTSHTLNLPASTFGPSQTCICLSTFGCECMCVLVMLTKHIAFYMEYPECFAQIFALATVCCVKWYVMPYLPTHIQTHVCEYKLVRS